MASTVNGVPTAPDAHGIIQGSFTGGSRISGDGGNNKLQGNAGNDVFYGGAGNDTFILKASALANASGPTAGNTLADSIIYDFSGAGGYFATNNDFLALSGFGKVGSTLTFTGYADGSGTQLQYYDIYSSALNETFTILLKSVNGKLLSAQDFAWY